MKRNQFVVLISGIILVVLLYQLPKVLVADVKEFKEEEPASNTSQENNFTSSHTREINSDQNQLLTVYKKQFFSLSEPEKRLIFADSIAEIFRKIGLFDSSAYYYSILAEQHSSPKILEKTGDAFYDAFSASSGEKIEYNEKARSCFEQVLKEQPANYEVKAKLAMTYLATDTPMKGITHLREILKNDPNNQTALYNLGILSIQSGQHDKAIDRFLELLKINPLHSNARFYLGLAYLNSGKSSKAKEEFLKAKQMDDDPAFQAIVDSYLKEINK